MGALDGLKILDFTTLLPGPYATLMLADMGAQVLTVSARDRLDLARHAPPMAPGTQTSANQAWLGRNKKTMFLNLKHPSALEIVGKLIMRYDVLMEQFRPGVMAKLGLDYQRLQVLNQRLIYCSITGYGQYGPLRDRAGHDINYLARSGNMSYSGRRQTGPVLTNMQVADIASGSLHAVISVLAALNHRHVTGLGQYIDVSMLDGAMAFNALDSAAFLASNIEPQREGRMLNGGSAYDFYETKDGHYLSVGSLEPQFWREFCLCIGRPQHIEGTVMPDKLDEVKTDIRAVIKSKTRDEWLEVFAGKDACVEPVLSLSEALLHDEHNLARGMTVEVEMPLHSKLKIRQVGSPLKLSNCPVCYKHAGYPLGHHTREVLDELGYSEAAMDDMEKHGVF